MSEPETPDAALERSLRALNAGHALDAVAAALQGILQLQIVQHLQALGMADDQAPEKGRAAVLEDRLNPFGECSEGHEYFVSDCPDCVFDAAQIADDTIPMEEPRER